MFLGIEIGGTKLQLGVGAGDGGPLAALERRDVAIDQGAEGIRRHIAEMGRELLRRYPVEAIGVGFGGPVDAEQGRTIKSHHVEGWTDFPLAAWCRETLDCPTLLANDADMAGLAEARFGAGRGHRVVFYITVGTGIGGALVIDGEVYPGSAGIAAELGHLRPGLQCREPIENLESLAAGWGIAARAQARLREPPDAATADAAAELLSRCGGRVDHLTTKMVADAAAAGNRLAEEVLAESLRALGWGIAQMITLLAPSVVIIGGGVSLAGEERFFAPVREHVRRYVFPPLGDTFSIVPAQLGEEVVVHGVLALAASRFGRSREG